MAELTEAVAAARRCRSSKGGGRAGGGVDGAAGAPPPRESSRPSGLPRMSAEPSSRYHCRTACLVYDAASASTICSCVVNASVMASSEKWSVACEAVEEDDRGWKGM